MLWNAEAYEIFDLMRRSRSVDSCESGLQSTPFDFARLLENARNQQRQIIALLARRELLDGGYDGFDKRRSV